MPSKTRAALVTAIEKLSSGRGEVVLTGDEAAAVLRQLPHVLVRAATDPGWNRPAVVLPPVTRRPPGIIRMNPVDPNEMRS